MARSVRFTPAAWDDYCYWQGQDKKTLKRINTLIDAASKEPFTGIGKPEPLLGTLAGYWLRRIDETPRPANSKTRLNNSSLMCGFVS